MQGVGRVRVKDVRYHTTRDGIDDSGEVNPMTTLKSLAVLAAILAFAPLTVPTADGDTAAETPPAPAIQLGAPFCDSMVLQRRMKVPVWGWSQPGDTITVEFDHAEGGLVVGGTAYNVSGKNDKGEPVEDATGFAEPRIVEI